jgi:putative nucleotidyltransferase with HDIG domain
MTTNSNSLGDLIAKTPDLPTMPQAALAVMREAGLPTSTAKSVADSIAKDQGLAARVLRLANSAYYGMPRQVHDIQEAVLMLGMRSIGNLATVASTYPWMAKPLVGYGLGPQEMWRHSFATAVSARQVAARCRMADPETCFTAGLLHNLGKVVLSTWLERRVDALARAIQRSDASFDEVERSIMGFDHAEVGAQLGEAWNLPQEIIAPARFHHRPDEAEAHGPLTDCVHVADYLAMSMGEGLGVEGMRYGLSLCAFERLGIAEGDVDGLLHDCAEQVRASQSMFEDDQQERIAA